MSLMPNLLFGDTSAKNSVLNYISCNGYCLYIGKRFVRRHYYQLQPYDMRTVESYKFDLSSSARNPGPKSSMGVKCSTPLSTFLPNLPLSAPIFYIHQIALVVGRTVLEHIQKELGN